MRIFILLILLTCTLSFADDHPLKELSFQDLVLLKEKKILLKTKDIKDSVWPEITFYTLIDASPLESMGIFSALDYQYEYTPNVLKSKPVKHLSPVHVLTEYELDVPFPLPNAKYTHGSIVSSIPASTGEDYQLSWYMLESTSTESVKGSAYFTAFEGKTLFRYRSFIVPKSALGKFIKNIMLGNVEKTIVAIKTHIEKLKREQSPLLAKYSGFITRSLNGEFVYQNIIEKK